MITSEYMEEGSIKSAERCVPDYETMISGLKKRLSKSNDLKHALLRYFQGHKASDKMAEIIGELVTECNMLEARIEELMIAQGRETNK